MDKKDCVINPKTGKMILGRKLKEPKKTEPKNLFLILCIKVLKWWDRIEQILRKKEFDKKKESNTMYKNPIGVSIKDIPKILVTGNNKILDRQYKTIYEYKKDGSMSMKRFLGNENSQTIDNDGWRQQLPHLIKLKKWMMEV